MRGDIIDEKGTLRVTRIHVSYHLKTADENRETAEEVHGFHADYCPMANTIRNCVEISTELHFET